MYILENVVRFLRYICGWKPAINIPTEDCVCVYCHTSYWDGFILFLYSYDASFLVVLKPQLFTWWSTPFLQSLGFISGPKLEERGTGGVQMLINKIKMAKKNRPIIFLISPKGTIQNRPWRSGYKYIAQGLGYPIIPMIVDYSRRTVMFKSASKSVEIEDLQNELSVGCPRTPNNSEIPIKICYDPFELLGVIDIVAFSNISMLPAIYTLYKSEDYYTGIIASFVFCTSWSYHSSCEQHYAELDSYSAKILIIFALIRYYRNISMNLINTCICAIFLYYIGTPRKSNEFRGSYVVYHSIYHCVLSYAAYQLVSGNVECLT